MVLIVKIVFCICICLFILVLKNRVDVLATRITAIEVKIVYLKEIENAYEQVVKYSNEAIYNKYKTKDILLGKRDGHGDKV